MVFRRKNIRDERHGAKVIHGSVFSADPLVALMSFVVVLVTGGSLFSACGNQQPRKVATSVPGENTGAVVSAGDSSASAANGAANTSPPTGQNGISTLNDALSQGGGANGSTVSPTPTPTPSPMPTPTPTPTATPVATGAVVVEFRPTGAGLTGTHSCQIKTSACPAQTGLALGSFFPDNHENAGTDSARCMRRAGEYAKWCDLALPLTVIAEYRVGEVVVTKIESMRDGCRIKLDACPLRAELSVGKFFVDDYDGSGSDKVRCLARAKEFADYCGMGAASSALAEFQGIGRIDSMRSPGVN